MVMTLSNPEAPATKKQLWLLHILTKQDTRELKITMAEANKRISELKGNKPKGDTARADYRVSGTRPLVNPHASAIKQDKQKLAQSRFDKKNPQPEVEFIQGVEPGGNPDMAMIESDFKAKCFQQGYDFANGPGSVKPNPDVRVDFYDFQCKDCLFGKAGICEPKWTSAGYVTSAQTVESVSFSCVNHEPIQYSISDYCHRTAGKQCHRKHVDNKCLECKFRSNKFRGDYSNNRNAWARYIPTIENRIKHHSFWLDKFEDKPEALAQVKHMIELISKLA
jgi:hypothetical protein